MLVATALAAQDAGNVHADAELAELRLEDLGDLLALVVALVGEDLERERLAVLHEQAVGVAILDSGIAPHPDLAGRIVAAVDFTSGAGGALVPPADPGGHGTHVAGIVAGDGTASGGAYAGVAPGANLIDVRVIGASGSTNVSTLIAGMQWVLAHRADYNIRVVNLSAGGPSTTSYRDDPLAAAAEVLVFAGITVVVSAGNEGPQARTITSPGSDPYVITVGGIDDNGTATTADDALASWSSRGVTPIDGDIRLGAMTTVATIEHHPTIQSMFPVLAQAAAAVGPLPVRNLGTVGGSVAHNAPGADSPPALLTLDARATVVSADGTRSVVLEDLFTGYFETAIRPDELLTEFRLPALPSSARSAYLKFATRSVDMALVGVGVVLHLEQHTIHEARIAIGGVAPVPFRAREAEAWLAGAEWSEAALREAGRLAASAASPASDLHASADYRRWLVGKLVPRALVAAASGSPTRRPS